MYVKKAVRNLMQELDDNLELPSKWNKFLKEEQIKNNLIIKAKTNAKGHFYRCTNCNIIFEDINKKINDYTKCPCCNNEYLIKSSNLKWFDFKKDLLLLVKYNNYWVFRIFELWSYNYTYPKNNYYCKTPAKKFEHDVIEYARIVFDENFNLMYELCNKHLNTSMTFSINHYNVPNSWRVFPGSWYGEIPWNGRVYPYNLKQLFKDTRWKYSQLWVLAKKCEDLNIVYQMQNNFASTEFLTKLGLYNLALDPKKYNKKGNFDDRFGVPKSYYPFMKHHNINPNQLVALKLLKVKDIDMIEWCAKLDNVAEELNKYISLVKLYKSGYKYNDERLYRDYLRLANDLGYDMKDKSILFPADLKNKHDELSELFELKKNKIVKDKIKKRYKELLKNTFKDKTYIIFPASSFAALQDESKQQNNCVKTYAEDYANGKTDLYFMRFNESQDKSLVTVEVKNNKLKQSRIVNNGHPGKQELSFLKKWEKNVLNKKVVTL
jgi:DNA-directed RNA polymerase subunit RPC12/RpoP